MSPVPRGSPVTRGFHRKRLAGPAGRVPPGQYLTADFPVLSAGPALRLLDADQPGFWENFGYNMYGDPWREQRYAGD
jgi:DMSO/TMAO reductase YedYZ molybdopterin-dependent catalytic subunit